MEATNVLLTNPKIFMNKNYLELVLKKNYPKTKIQITTQYGIPIKVLFTLSSNKEANKFISEYNGKSFTPDMK